MENKIETTFRVLREQGEKAFVAFVTAGDPDMESTEKNVRAMDAAGADIIELGVPFSDPIAEGAVIQRANLRALKNDVSLSDIFTMTVRLSGTIRAPLVLLTYLNPVFRYGYASFFRDAAAAGIRGVIVPDCPYEERGEFYETAIENNVIPITLVAPTSEERIMTLARAARGFLYLVSSMGVTGVRQSITTDISAIVRQIRTVSAVPVCVGFGISTPKQAYDMAEQSDGAIVGSAIVQLCERYGAAAASHLAAYVSELKRAVNGKSS